VLKKDLIRGRSIEGFVAASLMLAYRLKEIPKSQKKVSNASTRDFKENSRIYRLLVQEFNIKVPVPDSRKYVSKIIDNLGIPLKYESKIHEILKLAKSVRGNEGNAGKDPRGMAAAAVYIVTKGTDDKRTEKEIVKQVGVTEVTLRNRMVTLKPLFESLYN